MSSIRNVAIACQGGGSHAAFAAGVLVHLLGPMQRERFRLVALSGTSGGAMCAALAWRGLVDRGPDDAMQRLVRFWRDLEVHDLFDAFVNAWGVWAASQSIEVSPYLYEPIAEPRLRELLRLHLDLDHLDRDKRSRLKLFVGATDVLNGDRIIFEGENLRDDYLIASAAVPPLFRAVPGPDGRLFWDGLFTTNPPIRELTDVDPDEIWVIQINPTRYPREPREIRDIIDRRNELAGNLALEQELYFVQKINELLRNHPGLHVKYKPIQIRRVELGIEGLDYSSKVNRDGAFIERLLDKGRERAEWFFDTRSSWPRKGIAPPRSVVRL